MKKVSIIIPVYNVENYLEECLNSIIQQSYKNIEIILIDDGSTDKSGEICDKYARRDRRINVIHQNNRGAANAKNVGLDICTGEYFTFLDSDDYVDECWISTMFDIAEEKGADIVECQFVKEYINKSESIPYNNYTSGEYTAIDYMGIYLNDWTSSLFWNKLFRSELRNDIRFRQERRCIDDEFYTYKLLSKANRIVRIEKELYHYRQRKSSVVSTANNRIQKTDDALEILIERYEWIKKLFPDLKRIYLKHDVDILHYIKRDFLFTKLTAKKFKKIAFFYVKECLLDFPDWITTINAIMLCIRSQKKMIKNNIVMSSENEEDYYV